MCLNNYETHKKTFSIRFNLFPDKPRIFPFQTIQNSNNANILNPKIKLIVQNLLILNSNYTLLALYLFFDIADWYAHDRTDSRKFINVYTCIL